MAQHHYDTFLRERLWWYRATITLALTAQRIWRGHIGRSDYRKRLERRWLPDPSVTLNHEFWMECQSQAGRPHRSRGVFAEYILGRTPTAWSDHNTCKREPVLYFRDVKFYANTVTGKVMWDQPAEWADWDQRQIDRQRQVRELGYSLDTQEAASRFQAFWRACIARKNLSLILKAKSIMEGAEEEYLQNPQDMRAVSNYALWAHAIRHDNDQARLLYNSMLARMHWRGIDNAFVLYSTAIFLAATHEEDWHTIKDYAHRAQVADTSRQMRTGKEVSVFELADKGFYRQAAIMDGSGDSWHNYALCRMIVFLDHKGARRVCSEFFAPWSLVLDSLHG